MHRFLYFSAAIICGFSILTAFRPALQEDGAKPESAQCLVDSIGSAEPMRSALLGVLAVKGDCDTILSYNPYNKLLPASNTKLITTGIAMLQLGPDWQFTTTLQSNSSICNGELNGDLYIVGGGDPTIGANYDGTPKLEETFTQWKAILDSLGVKKINGKVIGDGRYFEGDPIPDSWAIFDMGYDYFGACEALNVYQNTIRIKIPGGAAPDQILSGPISTKPELPWLNVESEAVTTRGLGNKLYAIPGILRPCAYVKGTLGVKHKAAYLKITNNFPAYTCAQLFHNFLVNNGFEISDGYADVGPLGNVRTDLNNPHQGPDAQTGMAVLGSTRSVPLKQIITDCNRDSDNFYAETLLRTVGKNVLGAADYKTCKAGRDTMFRRLGLELRNGCNLVDGSGLSRENNVSPDFFVRFLKAMSKTPVFPHYLESLPQPGKGTLEFRLKSEPDSLKQRVFMKSGSMGGVVCFSGYILPQDGNPENTIIFSIMTNNVSGPASHVYKLLESIIARLAREN